MHWHVTCISLVQNSSVCHNQTKVTGPGRDTYAATCGSEAEKCKELPRSCSMIIRKHRGHLKGTRWLMHASQAKANGFVDELIPQWISFVIIGKVKISENILKENHIPLKSVLCHEIWRLFVKDVLYWRDSVHPTCTITCFMQYKLFNFVVHLLVKIGFIRYKSTLCVSYA